MKMKTQGSQILQDAANVPLRGTVIEDIEQYRHTLRSKKKTRINYLILHFKQLKRRGANKTQNRGKEIMKKAEINKIGIKKTIQKINESKSWFFENTVN